MSRHVLYLNRVGGQTAFSINRRIEVLVLGQQDRGQSFDSSTSQIRSIQAVPEKRPLDVDLAIFEAGPVVQRFFWLSPNLKREREKDREGKEEGRGWKDGIHSFPPYLYRD